MSRSLPQFSIQSTSGLVAAAHVDKRHKTACKREGNTRELTPHHRNNNLGTQRTKTFILI